MGHVYTMPTHLPFARTLAKGLLARSNNDPQELAKIRLLLPTRRACRIVQEAFLRESEGAALLLPKLQPLGEADPEEMMLSTPDPALAEIFATLPPAIPEMKRRMVMAGIIEKRLETSATQSLKLAIELCALLDQLYTENLNIEDLETLAPDDFAQHWQITLDFLEIFKTTWPEKLKQLSMMESVNRRNHLLGAWAQSWAKTPPKEYVIAAGMTGSIPAAANFLNVVKNMANAEILLPGVDLHLEDDAWESIEQSHPQYGLYRLLSGLEVTRSDIKNWPESQAQEIADIETLSSEMMRPAASTLKWQNLSDNFSPDASILENISRINATSPLEEAMSIALIMRETLEDKNKTAKLVTADRNLARRVSEILKRWNVVVDDSAGIPLLKTPRGNFLMQVLQAAKHRGAPIALLSLLKHQYMGDKHADNLRNDVRRLDLKNLRGIFTQKLLDTACKKSSFLSFVLQTLNPLLDAGYQPLDKWIKLHINAAQELATTKQKEGVQRLWSGEDGEALSNFFADLIAHADKGKTYSLSEYIDLVDMMASNLAVRPKYGTHPRLGILGIMESRLSDADVVILGGLNEGTWPPAPNNDPWLSRPMREKIGLPTQEQQIGFSAHDFVQHFCAANVVLTRCQKEGGALTVPSRWLTRLDTVLHALGLALKADTKYISWAKQIDAWGDKVTPADRPAPRPPINLRPDELSVTNFEHWMGDPYAVYAKYVLGLRKADDLEKQADAAMRGEIIHDVMHQYMQDHLNDWPDDAAQDMVELAGALLLDKGFETPQALDWWPRLVSMLDAFSTQEAAWRAAGNEPAQLEHEGQTKIAEFTITAKADRLDIMSDGSAAIIDYKTGSIGSTTATKTGHLPQLPLEALILQDGGFGDLPANDVSYMAFWELTGNDKEPTKQNQIKPAKDETIADILNVTREGVTNLITTFKDDSVPYYSLPNPAVMPTYRDYDHLARFKEWANEDGEGSE